MKTVLITGGSRGIGRACVKAFAAEGYQVAFCYRKSKEEAEELSHETGAQGFVCDVRKEAEVQALFKAVLKLYHHLDALVLCAGTAYTGLLQDMTADEFDDLYAVHLKSAFLCCREALPAMYRAQKGVLLLISSMWGQVGASCECAYSACKAGVIGLGKALAKEAGESGVRVNVIAPGVIDTDMMKEYAEETKAHLRMETPLKRLGTPEDIAQAALFLCSPNASFITGQVLGVNGGFVIT